MHFSHSLIFASLLACASQVAAVGVVGKAFGFAVGTTGGGSATPVYPKDIKELVSYLTDSSARVIVLNKEYNFLGSEGKVTEKGCRPSSNTCPGKGGQDAINGANWCNGQPSISVTYDKAGISPINVKSNKSIIGLGSSGVIRGKGLRIANGAQNIIIQNIHITELNPQYIWGGDAITIVGSDLIWIDHVKTSLIGRQHMVSGYAASNRITISNSEIDGNTSWSASCDNRHYWALLFIGQGDRITFAQNYVHHTSGRSPKIGGSGSGTIMHAVNNYFYDNSGHAFDIAETESGRVVAEGNVFEKVKTPLLGGAKFMYAALDATVNKLCKPQFGHNCVSNLLKSSGTLTGSATSYLGLFKGEVSPLMAADKVAASVKANAGVGKI